MKLTRLKTNHLDRPLGYDCSRVTLCYTVEESAGTRQTAARIQLALAPDEAHILQDTGVTQDIDNLGWVLPWPLESRTRYWWRVWVQTDANEQAWSDWTWFETPKEDAWQGKAITSPLGPDVHPIIYTTFTADKPVVSARMYCLGLGLYEAYLNGEKLGEEVLQPGFHTYDGFLMTQTFELSVAPGENTLAFLMGDGWYKGRYGLKASAPRYGTDYALLAEIRLCHEDGCETVIATDESWRVRRSPVVMDSIYDGETIDARIMADEESFDAVPSTLNMDKLTPRCNPAMRVQEKREAVQLKPGLFDFGQNMVGWVEFDCDAPAGTQITLRFAEILKDGELYTENLRGAKATFTYISDGVKRRVRPHFTFFGFRYMSVEGWNLEAADLTGCVIYSDMERTGWIETANEKVNRLFENTIWSQKGNFLDVPTDCPQRDERMGWTGDIQIFADTALYHMDCTAMLSKYLRDLRWDQQLLGGSVPCVSPMTGYCLGGVTAWGDAAAIVPWQTYLHSGDKAVLRDSLQSMMDWVDWITRDAEKDGTGRLWSQGIQLGDWLALDGNSVYGGTDRGMIATAYYWYSAHITASAAKALGEEGIARAYARLADEIRDAFQAEYFSSTGRITVDTQTACILALYLNLVPENGRKRTQELLRRKVTEAGVRLETGFVGTPWLMPALTDAGYADLAYGLLLREDYPGWLYEINRGATTIWERWNSIEPDGEMNRDGMNSFNHYAYGSVAAWMYRTMGGIAPVEDAPGFRQIRCAPVPDRRIPWVKVHLNTGSGLCSVQWQWQGDEWQLEVTVPFGCTMDLYLPDGSPMQQLTSGVHGFSLTMPPTAVLGLETPWREVLDCPATRAVVERLFPRAIRGVAFQYEMYTMRQLTQSPFAELTKEEIVRLEEELIRVQMQA